MDLEQALVYVIRADLRLFHLATDTVNTGVSVTFGGGTSEARPTTRLPNTTSSFAFGTHTVAGSRGWTLNLRRQSVGGTPQWELWRGHLRLMTPADEVIAVEVTDVAWHSHTIVYRRWQGDAPEFRGTLKRSHYNGGAPTVDSLGAAYIPETCESLEWWVDGTKLVDLTSTDAAVESRRGESYKPHPTGSGEPLYLVCPDTSPTHGVSIRSFSNVDNRIVVRNVAIVLNGVVRFYDDCANQDNEWRGQGRVAGGAPPDVNGPPEEGAKVPRPDYGDGLPFFRDPLVGTSFCTAIATEIDWTPSTDYGVTWAPVRHLELTSGVAYRADVQIYSYMGLDGRMAGAIDLDGTETRRAFGSYASTTAYITWGTLPALWKNFPGQSSVTSLPLYYHWPHHYSPDGILAWWRYALRSYADEDAVRDASDDWTQRWWAPTPAGEPRDWYRALAVSHLDNDLPLADRWGLDLGILVRPYPYSGAGTPQAMVPYANNGWLYGHWLRRWYLDPDPVLGVLDTYDWEQGQPTPLYLTRYCESLVFDPQHGYVTGLADGLVVGGTGVDVDVNPRMAYKFYDRLAGTLADGTVVMAAYEPGHATRVSEWWTGYDLYDYFDGAAGPDFGSRDPDPYPWPLLTFPADPADTGMPYEPIVWDRLYLVPYTGDHCPYYCREPGRRLRTESGLCRIDRVANRVVTAGLQDQWDSIEEGAHPTIAMVVAMLDHTRPSNRFSKIVLANEWRELTQSPTPTEPATFTDFAVQPEPVTIGTLPAFGTSETGIIGYRLADMQQDQTGRWYFLIWDARIARLQTIGLGLRLYAWREDEPEWTLLRTIGTVVRPPGLEVRLILDRVPGECLIVWQTTSAVDRPGHLRCVSVDQQSGALLAESVVPLPAVPTPPVGEWMTSYSVDSKTITLPQCWYLRDAVQTSAGQLRLRCAYSGWYDPRATLPSGYEVYEWDSGRGSPPMIYTVVSDGFWVWWFEDLVDLVLDSDPLAAGDPIWRLEAMPA